MRKKSKLKRYARLRRWFRRLVNIGVTNDMIFDDILRTRIINLVAILGIFSSFAFFIYNISDNRVVLAFLNLATTLSLAFLLYSNYRHKYYIGQVAISIILSIVFAISSLLYRNGMEFYLLIIAALVMTIMKRGGILSTIYVINCVIFLLLIHYGDNFHFYPPVPDNVYFINIVIWVSFYVLFFWYFRELGNSHRRQMEHKNEQLESQQQKLMEQTILLENNNRQLQVLNTTKEKLFSIVAHDVRSPIAGLRSTLQLYRDTVLTKQEFEELVEELSTQLEQLNSSLENLLKWSNSQMRGLDIQKKQVFLEPLILDTLTLLQYNLTNKNIQCDVVSDGNNLIEADPDHVKLIIRNLISNAIKFSYAGSNIKLVTEKIGLFVNFSVTDSGIGMSDEAIRNLFSPTSLSTTRGTSNEKGTGVGLKLCKEFAETKSGNITVHRNEEAGGCTFTFTIPAALT